MTQTDIIKLRLLRGTLKGQRTVLKCQVAAAAATRDVAKSDAVVAIMTGKIMQGVDAIRMVQCSIRELSQIIKEANHA